MADTGGTVIIAALVAGVVSLLVTTLTAAWAGRQKIAQARMEWNARHRVLSVDFYRKLEELRTPSADRAAIRAAIAPIAVEILLMINPDGRGQSAIDEGQMEANLLSRLAAEGVTIDIDLVRYHRAVLKHAWRTAKDEYWRSILLPSFR